MTLSACARYVALVPLCIGLAAADPAPKAPLLKGWILAGGGSIYGLTAGLKYRPPQSATEYGVRAAYFPEAHAFDVHAFLTPQAVFPTYWGMELIYAYDTSILTDRNYKSFETVSLQGILGKEFSLSERWAIACEGGGGVNLWAESDFQGGGVPIYLPVSIMARAELLFGL